MSEAMVVGGPYRSKELEFSVNGLKLTAKSWGEASGVPTIALHGWLDNANSYDRLAPLLPELDLIALDFAGHGFSSHRPEGVHYTSLLDVQDVIAVANELEWTRFNLIGHSMGAAVASELTGLFPERVNRAVMIDGFVHHNGDAHEAVRASREAIEQMLNPSPRRAPVYPDLDAMIRRVSQATDQSWDAAAILVARGHRRVRDGYGWRTDRRIRFSSPHRMSDEQLDALMQRASVPSLLIVAERGDLWYRDGIARRAAHHPALTVERLDGPHHIHLETQVPQVAALVRSFFELPA